MNGMVVLVDDGKFIIVKFKLLGSVKYFVIYGIDICWFNVEMDVWI